MLIFLVVSVLAFGPEMMKQKDVACVQWYSGYSKTQFCQLTTTKIPYWPIPELLLLVPRGNNISMSIEYRRNEVNHKPY